MTLLSEMTLQSGIFILLLILLRPFLKGSFPPQAAMPCGLFRPCG